MQAVFSCTSRARAGVCIQTKAENYLPKCLLKVEFIFQETLLYNVITFGNVDVFR